ncbi:NtaA/DmoA family FMN-dependent monooxygenase [Streptomyces poriferorum]|uniref:NtaA/DmoA family FMN-dependent monooxygenase n=1 Tax=Streptomyces TaxID=1883 RepID=UPI001C5D3F10|nr:MULTISPECIES: NtaA/DmoA family FMN-dependent monooxygenase [Streptomyces]MBW5252249.1 NtaA/DmoA family FMN-dependent monooxygenase [Streptomyces poriferorum]MBW5258878.1 NtaA/DmoA family FMN-dependent monooxygenase [Streptomyces poriferorum]WLQ47450.1 NtaA/DmoA family FMN-dependent monooxygenase [Streptomyces sp. Alt1]WSI62271.1 NtaA/DmoA family FMN-dependent monooxygenase [Streptomyces sp. NBC_01336]
MTAAPKQMHLAAHFPVDDTTVWDDPRSGSQIEFASFAHLARTAERGLFDFLLLAEGLRLREHDGLVDDLDVAGRPDPLTVLPALAAVTDRLGLAASAGATFHEPYELARRFATLDHLSAGRSAWNVVTSADASTAENFRRAGQPDRADGDGYARTAEFVATTRELWDSWTPDGSPRPFAHHGRHFSAEGEFTVPRSPQGHPVVIRAVDGAQDREFAAAVADVVLTRHGTPRAGRAFCADVRSRLAKYGREPGGLRIMPGIGVVLGDSDADARERAAGIRLQQVSPQHAIAALERIWGRDLSSYDPDGPLPACDPDPAAARAGHGDALAVAARWRELSREKGLSIRGTVIEATDRQPLVGSPETVAAEMTRRVAAGAADGFVLVPHLTPGGLDDFVDRVVPLLQERGVFRTAYTGSTLRSHLGLAAPVWKG